MKYRLKVIMAERDLTMEDLEKITGFHYNTLRKVRDNIKGVKDTTLEIIAKKLGIKEKDLIILDE